MSQESLILLAGSLVLATPFLGIPNAYDRWVYGALGFIIVVIGYRLRRAAYFRSIENEHGEHASDAFVESRTPHTTSSVPEASGLQMERV